jgi:hypothetical protein
VKLNPLGGAGPLLLVVSVVKPAPVTWLKMTATQLGAALKTAIDAHPGAFAPV